jgi:hypothetical protein
MKFSIFLTMIAWFLFQAPVFQQETNSVTVSNELPSEGSLFETLQQDQPFEMTLETNFRHLNSKRNDLKYQPARLTYTDSKGVNRQLDVEVRPRGNMRRMTCEFPPLKIKFSDSDADKKTLKLVSVCKSSGYYEQLLLREYAAYRLYNILTRQSLKVQLVKMKYVDENEKNSPEDSYAFLIEHHDDMAERNGGKDLEQEKFSLSLLDCEEFERLSLFEFMIGNTDWMVYSGHNIKKYGIPGTSKLVFVPYDFDYSGFVNAPYAVPDERLNLPDITDRYYMGLSRTEEQTMQNVRLFLDKKEEILRFCREFPYFDKKSRKHTLKYINSFYDIIENPKRLKTWIFNHSNQWPNPRQAYD